MEFIKTVFVSSFKFISIPTPILNYYPQYRLMKRSQSVGSFTKLTCFLLLFSNLSRVVFWFGNDFETCLLLSSLVIILMQLLLLKVYHELTDEHKQEIPITKLENTKQNLNIFSYWEKLTSSHFAFTIFGFFVFFVYLLCLFRTYQGTFIVGAIGVFSSCVEAILPLPQFYNNWRNKSVESLRLIY